MKARQEQQALTRQRIVDAVVALHEEVGPSQTTIKAIAERAGVERLTVYRHFPDERSLLAACSSCWSQRHPPPGPRDWIEEDAPLNRVRRALTLLYRYFSRHQRMLRQVHRDVSRMDALAEVAQPFLDHLRQIADDLASGFRGTDSASAPITSILRVAVRFETWCVLQEEAPDDALKVGLVVRWVGVHP